VYTTAVGFAGGHTPNPTYDEVEAGRTGHAEVVRVVFDPSKTSFEALLRLFWEGRDPTAHAPQDSDARMPHRSAIYCASDAQRREAQSSRDAYQRLLSAAGFGTIRTEIVDGAEFHYAEDSHQQYLAKNPGSHAGLRGTGVRFVGSGPK
jgi:peptide-methionine (S)-S-oxide reductase